MKGSRNVVIINSCLFNATAVQGNRQPTVDVQGLFCHKLLNIITNIMFGAPERWVAFSACNFLLCFYNNWS
jgi:hypothetical protein